MTSFPPSERSRQALGHIREAIGHAQSFVEGYDMDRLATDLRTLFAVVRCLEIVSEASRRLDAAVKDRHPQLPWKRIADAGNVYRHVYDGVRTELVWRTVTADLPTLLAAVEAELGLSG